MTIIAVTVVLALLAGSVYAPWKAHEEKKAEQLAIDRRLRQRYDAVMGVSGPRPAGSHETPWKNRRVS